jgi:hypothetical protein
MTRTAALLAALLLVILASACSNGSSNPAPAPVITPDPFAVGRPQERAGIGDVDRAFARYASTRSDLIQLFQDQPWFQDGLTRDEALFVERALSFAAGQQAASLRSLNPASIRDKLYLHETVQMQHGVVDLLLIYEPGQDAQRQMSIMAAVMPEMERLVGVQWPEKAVTVVNGNYSINDYNEGAFIRMDRCCLLSSFVLAHELAHTYWSRGPFWFNEGMADIYAILALQALRDDLPDGWTSIPADIDDYYLSRKARVDSGRFPDMPLTRRFAQDGLYEVADVFLLDIRQIIGPDAFLAAARDIYTSSDFGRLRLSEKRVQDIVLAHTRPADREDVMDLFNKQVWGDDGERYRQLQEFEDP